MAPLSSAVERYFGIFAAERNAAGERSLVRRAESPSTVPCPNTGQPLRVATIDGRARAICPSCEVTAEGGFVSFVGDLRLVYACPSCEQVVWLPGA
jgi:hypothetical protein